MCVIIIFLCAGHILWIFNVIFYTSLSYLLFMFSCSDLRVETRNNNTFFYVSSMYIKIDVEQKRNIRENGDTRNIDPRFLIRCLTYLSLGLHEQVPERKFYFPFNSYFYCVQLNIEYIMFVFS